MGLSVGRPQPVVGDEIFVAAAWAPHRGATKLSFLQCRGLSKAERRIQLAKLKQDCVNQEEPITGCPLLSSPIRLHAVSFLGGFRLVFLLTHPVERRSSAQDRASPEKPPSTTLSADDLKEQRQKELDAMGRRAEATTVWRIDWGENQAQVDARAVVSL